MGLFEDSGRVADLQYLNDKYKQATTAKSREVIREAAHKIKNESQHVQKLRSEMVKAKRDGDQDRFLNIQEHMHHYYG